MMLRELIEKEDNHRYAIVKHEGTLKEFPIHNIINNEFSFRKEDAKCIPDLLKLLKRKIMCSCVLSRQHYNYNTCIAHLQQHVLHIQQEDDPFFFYGGPLKATLTRISFSNFSLCRYMKHIITEKMIEEDKNYTVFCDPENSSIQHIHSQISIGAFQRVTYDNETKQIFPFQDELSTEGCSILSGKLIISNGCLTVDSVLPFKNSMIQQYDMLMYNDEECMQELIRIAGAYCNITTHKRWPHAATVYYCHKGAYFINMEHFRWLTVNINEKEDITRLLSDRIVTMCRLLKTNPIELVFSNKIDRLWMLCRQEKPDMKIQFIPMGKKNKPMLPFQFKDLGITEETYFKENLTGGLILKPVPGKISCGDLIVTLDFKSFYPSIMIADNLCPSTMIHPTSFTRDYTGVIPMVQKKLIELRKNKPEHSTVVKLLSNATYGLLSAKWAPFFSHYVAAAITARGRELLQSALEHINQLPCCVVLFGNTDSIIVRVKQWYMNELKNILKNVEFPNPIKLELQSVKTKAIILGCNQYVFYEEGKPLVIKGLLAINKTVCKWQSDKLIQFYESLLHNKEWKEIVKDDKDTGTHDAEYTKLFIKTSLREDGKKATLLHEKLEEMSGTQQNCISYIFCKDIRYPIPLQLFTSNMQIDTDRYINEILREMNSLSLFEELPFESCSYQTITKYAKGKKKQNKRPKLLNYTEDALFFFKNL